MFLHFTTALSLAVQVMAPAEDVISDIVKENTHSADVKFIVDKDLQNDQFVFKMGDLSINANDKKLLSDLISISSALKEVPTELKEIFNELSMKNEDLVSDLRSGAYSFAVLFTDDVEAIKILQGIEKIRHIKFFLSSSKTDAESLGVSFPGVMAYSSSDKNILKLPFPTSLDGLVASVSVPAFSSIDQENFKYLQSLDQKLFYVIDGTRSFADNKKDFNSGAKQCSSFAKFVFFTPADVPTLVPLLKVKESDYPVLLSLAREGKCIVKSLKPEGFLSGVQSLITQTAEKIIFSSPIPEDNETRPVRVLSTETLLPTFSPSSDRDVLVAFTSPSCKYCQALTPVLEKFSKLLIEKNIPLVVGNYNVMENEEPKDFEVSGVPSIYFLKKGATTPVKLAGEIRTLPLFLDYISKEGITSKIDLADFEEHMKAEKESEIPIFDNEEEEALEMSMKDEVL